LVNIVVALFEKPELSSHLESSVSFTTALTAKQPF
jgi:hypothetical protein